MCNIHDTINQWTKTATISSPRFSCPFFPLLPAFLPSAHPTLCTPILCTCAPVLLQQPEVYLLQQSSSDPYCKCEVVGKPLSRFRTKTVDQNLFPKLGLVE